MTKTYDEDPPQEALPRRAKRELGITHVRAWQHDGHWVVSGYKDGELRLFTPRGKGWDELTVGREVGT